MINYILAGMQYGDEGKGSFVDFLANQKQADCIVRYNGGSQASHTVVTSEGILHKFCQLGSGMFYEGSETYLTENVVVNLESLLCEAECFSRETGIPIEQVLKRIKVHENCYIVTPYHILMNMLRELSQGENRRGTVGTGVSEVRKILEETSQNKLEEGKLEESKLEESKLKERKIVVEVAEGKDKERKVAATATEEEKLGVQVKDIMASNSESVLKRKFRLLQLHVKRFQEKNWQVIQQNLPEDEALVRDLYRKISFLLRNRRAYEEMAMIMKHYFSEGDGKILFAHVTIISSNLDFREKHRIAIFEGAQGLLLDAIYGTRPNTTFLDTTAHFAKQLILPEDETKKIGIAKAFYSRHGLGAFPTEDVALNQEIMDTNQSESFWNGRIRFGWFDAVLMRYAQRVNQVEELYLSALDQLDALEVLKICNEYEYVGEVDEEFAQVFSYEIGENSEIIVHDIKASSEKLGKYLEKCVPQYWYGLGWKKDISKMKSKEELPISCMMYLRKIEEMVKIPITVVSVGPTRENKIVLTDQKSVNSEQK